MEFIFTATMAAVLYAIYYSCRRESYEEENILLLD